MKQGKNLFIICIIFFLIVIILFLIIIFIICPLCCQLGHILIRLVCVCNLLHTSLHLHLVSTFVIFTFSFVFTVMNQVLHSVFVVITYFTQLLGFSGQTLNQQIEDWGELSGLCFQVG